MLIERDLHSRNAKTMIPMRRELLLPLAAALTAAIGYVLRKMGLNVYPEPIIGIAIGHQIALCLYIFLWALSKDVKRHMSLNIHTLKLFWKPAIVNCIGWLFTFHALSYAPC